MTSLTGPSFNHSEPWDNLIFFPAVEQQRIHSLTTLLTSLMITSHTTAKREYLLKLRRHIERMNNFADIYTAIALETIKMNSPLYEQSFRSAISPHHLRETFWNPQSAYIPLSIRELISWCNGAVPLLVPGTLITHRVA